MAPGVVQCRSQSVPTVDSPTRLRAVVCGVGGALFPVNVVAAGVQRSRHTTSDGRIVIRGDGRRGRLVDVAEVEQLVTGRTDVTDLENHAVAQFLLQVEVVIL